MSEETEVPAALKPLCKGARLVTGAQGIFGPMSLVCITCGATVAEWSGESNGSAAAWIKESGQAVKLHQSGK